ncbi:sulfurtransferase TusA family protein [Clostridium formicaceticum]|uniref:Ferredoxin--nitrite reductase n=1 Tax=Clostridium formicaceticum TaxID=1497 RepID=A0AAC9WFM7_9CLOT|nr:sulfurtransferase TusA family protein [Clostridium formicaceticum]AOY76514.1 ferredoxin--nitrite reductase [Clostridium formicaceticum]ARE86926.1 Sulfite reductase [Clostridium formicaceticum]
MIKIPQQVIEEEKSYRNKVEDLKKGIIEAERFKPYRVSMGIYEQRDNDTYMIRTRIPSGVITLEQFKKISELAKKYSHGFIHFTTRQDIQFHKVTLDDTVDIMEGLLEADIVTRGTGGNTARNVGCSPLSGVSQEDVFDVTPYALATTEYALKDPTMLNLPRKYKMAYSSSPEDTGNATIADLGFIAKIKDGEKGFEVYGAGGLGGSPNVAIKLEDFIPASEVLYHVQAMKELFENEGDRTNKHKARIRYILKRLGEEGFKAKYQEVLQKIKKERSIEVFFNTQIPTKQIGKREEISHPLLLEQKNKGYYALYVHAENGNLRAEDLDKVINFIHGLNYEASIRLTTTQGFFVRDLTGDDAKKLLDIISSFTSPFPIDNSVACAGAATCKLGLCLSQNLLSVIKNRFLKADETIKIQLPRIFISGCQNSCGQHQKGEIGLYGKAKRVADGLVPMYAVLFGGAVGVGKAVLGKGYGMIPAQKIPDFLYELANLKKESGIEEITVFVKKEKEAVDKLIEDFSSIEPEAENSKLYYDFGAEEKFSLKGRGPGECSAGVLDVIQLDISNAEGSIKEFEKTKASIKLYDASVSAARALLILKGIDTTKDRLILKEFSAHFIDGGYVKESIKNLIEDLLDYKLGDLDSLEKHYEEVKYLLHRVSQMYASLNPKLEITLAKEQEIEDAEDEIKVTEDSSLKIIDLKGVKCPINFVKAKVEIAKISSNEIIGFYLDNGEPIANVPKSLAGEGHEIIKIDDKYEGYNLLIVKKK